MVFLAQKLQLVQSAAILLTLLDFPGVMIFPLAQHIHIHIETYTHTHTHMQTYLHVFERGPRGVPAVDPLLV